VKNKEQKKWIKKSKKLVVRKVLWDDTYGEQPPFHALGDTGHPSERDY
jgi:hypothetical protein